MNTLSWFIYAADTLPSFALLVSFIGGLAFIIGIILFIPGKLVTWNHQLASVTLEESKAVRKTIGEYAVRFLAFGFILLCLSTIIPSKKTFYMIAASEVGEVVIKSEETREVFEELKNAIMHQLRELQEQTAAPPKTNTSSL